MEYCCSLTGVRVPKSRAEISYNFFCKWQRCLCIPAQGMASLLTFICSINRVAVLHTCRRRVSDNARHTYLTAKTSHWSRQYLEMARVEYGISSLRVLVMQYIQCCRDKGVACETIWLKLKVWLIKVSAESLVHFSTIANNFFFTHLCQYTQDSLLYPDFLL